MLNADEMEVLKKAFFSLAIKGTGAVLSFSFSLLLARTFGAEGVGLYGIVVTSTIILSTLAVMGIDNASLKNIAIHFSKSETNKVADYVLNALLLVSFFALTAYIIEYFGAEILSIIFANNPAAVELFQAISFVLIPLCLSRIVVASLKGMKRVVSAQFTDGIIMQSTAIVYILLLPASSPIIEAINAYKIGFIAAFVAGLMLLVPNIQFRAAKFFDTHISRNLVYTGFPTLGVILGSYITVWACTFMIAHFSTAQDVGFFRVCWQITFLLSFFMTAIDAIVAPKISALFHDGDNENLAKLLQKTLFGLVLITFTVASVIIIFRIQILELFGPEFKQAVTVLIVLTCGHAINSTLGISGRILVMTGFEKKSFTNSMLGAGLVMILSFILVPQYGGIGAAFAAAITQTVRCLSATFIVARSTGLNIVTGTYSQPMKGNISV
jgi:O-antigen/teichoic acid export membrane protein